MKIMTPIVMKPLDPQSMTENSIMNTHESSEAETVKISFHLDIDELADVAQKIGQRYKLPKLANFSLIGFFLVNTIVLPVILFVFGAGWIAFAALVMNLLFGGIFLQKAVTIDTRRFFRQLYGDIESIVAEVELTNEGLWCRTNQDISFFKWESILAIEESPKAIHFMFREKGLPVMKSGFPYRESEREFYRFAEDRIAKAKARTQLNSGTHQ